MATAIIIAFGRQFSVFTQFRPGLWFFSRFELKRAAFTFTALIFVIIGLFVNLRPISLGIATATMLLCAFSFFFDMRRFFPELTKTHHHKPADIALDGAHMVIGTTKTTPPVAYPLEEVLIPRHLINDTVGKRPILASYCALCRSGILLDPVVKGKRLTFAVAGVWRRNMFIVDNETGSLWQQATGECIYGHYKGMQLAMIPSMQTPWATWRKINPETVLSTEPSGIPKALFQHTFLNHLLNFVTNHVTIPGQSNRLKELGPRETVFGICIGTASKTYPMGLLEKINKVPFEDRIGDQSVSLLYDSESQTLTAWEKDTQNKIPVEKHWWLGWVEFHPDTVVYTHR